MYSSTKIADVIIGRGSIDDAAELASFAARNFENAFSADNDPDDLQAHLAGMYNPARQAEELADPLVTTILARSSGELVAFAQVRRSVAPTCVKQAAPIELHRFYVDRPAHGTGLASKLMQAVHQAAHEFHGLHIWLGVWEKNPRAIAFYMKENFVDVGSTLYTVGTDKQTDRVLVTPVIESRDAAVDP
ncbi:MAG: GNAT family N-acetyltransferase [Woeseiaceae bacterium]